MAVDAVLLGVLLVLTITTGKVQLPLRAIFLRVQHIVAVRAELDRRHGGGGVW